MPDAIPEGFLPLETNSPFNQSVGPFYCRQDGDSLVMGLLIGENHCNTSGRLHGGMVATLADIALGHNVGFALGYGDTEKFEAFRAQGVPGAPIATVSMTTDYAGTARLGDWVEVRVDVQHAGKSIAFANAYLHSGDRRIARSSAVYKVLER